MSAPRTFLRFAISGLFIGVLAAACTVKETNDDDETSCNPGDKRACNCSNGDEGERKCNSDGDGYGSCVCDGNNAGGTNAGGDGAGPSAGTGGTGGYSGGYTGGTAGTTAGGTTYGGTSAGGTTYGGTSAGGASEGGAGGSPEVVTPEECAEDLEDNCASCYQTGCCDEWVACLDDTVTSGDDCSAQFFNILACAQVDRENNDVTPADLKACGEDEISGGSAWSDGLRPQVKPLIDCVAGGTGWGSNSSFSTDACKVSCFDKL
jgi:hypothetical protein